LQPSIFWFRLKSSFSFYFKSKSKYRIHSPFTFHLIKNCFDNDVFDDVNVLAKTLNVREFLKADTTTFTYNDLGAAGSSYQKALKVSDVYRKSVSSHNKSLLLYRIARYLKPDTIIECGTSLGVNAGYLSSAAKNKYIGIEGDEFLALKTKSILKLFGNNHEVVNGEIEEELRSVLNRSSGDNLLIYLDGNHTYEALKSNVNLIIDQINNRKTYVIVDDIRWSKQMYEAWTELKQSSNVGLSLDFFQFGLITLNMKVRKQSIKIYNQNMLSMLLMG
jgi:predicted O-methyltransferase YrrM|tara:strand:+ start:8982 stop:9809 length:828 start_codon:yes stop_codon:yes gene_type:complete